MLLYWFLTLSLLMSLVTVLSLSQVLKMKAKTIQGLERALKWEKAKSLAHLTDLERVREKLEGRPQVVQDWGMDLPQRNSSYWKFQAKKLETELAQEKARVSDLEMALENCQSKLMWQ